MKRIVIASAFVIGAAGVGGASTRLLKKKPPVAASGECDEDSLSLSFVPACYAKDFGDRAAPEVFLSVTTHVEADGRVREVQIAGEPKVPAAEQCVRDQIMQKTMRAKGVMRQRQFNVGLRPGFNLVASETNTSKERSAQ
jgi:hypothetical protein